MPTKNDTFSNVAEMLRAMKPAQPVYCVYPQLYLQVARDFVADFSGRVLYAVKANDDPDVVETIYEGGVRHFECA